MTTTATTTTDPKIEAVLAEVADNVDWAAEAAGDAVPWWGPHLGRTEVPQFFQEIASNVDITEFEVLSHLAGRDDVISTVHWTFTVKATGKPVAMYMQHWWKFSDGKIMLFRGFEDTDQTARAFAH